MPTVVGRSALFELHLTAERLYFIGEAKADGDWTERSIHIFLFLGVEDLEFTSFLKA